MTLREFLHNKPVPHRAMLIRLKEPVEALLRIVVESSSDCIFQLSSIRSAILSYRVAVRQLSMHKSVPFVIADEISSFLSPFQSLGSVVINEECSPQSSPTIRPCQGGVHQHFSL